MKKQKNTNFYAGKASSVVNNYAVIYFRTLKVSLCDRWRFLYTSFKLISAFLIVLYKWFQLALKALKSLATAWSKGVCSCSVPTLWAAPSLRTTPKMCFIQKNWTFRWENKRRSTHLQEGLREEVVASGTHEQEKRKYSVRTSLSGDNVIIFQVHCTSDYPPYWSSATK